MVSGEAEGYVGRVSRETWNCLAQEASLQAEESSNENNVKSVRILAEHGEGGEGVRADQRKAWWRGKRSWRRYIFETVELKNSIPDYGNQR